MRNQRKKETIWLYYLFGTIMITAVFRTVSTLAETVPVDGAQKGNRSLKLRVAETVKDPIKGDTNTKIIGPKQFEVNELIAALKSMCRSIRNLDKHYIKIFTNSRFYQAPEFAEVLRNAPFYPESKDQEHQNLSLLYNGVHLRRGHAAPVEPERGEAGQHHLPEPELQLRQGGEHPQPAE